MQVTNDQVQNLTSNIDLIQQVKSTGPVTSARIDELKQILAKTSNHMGDNLASLSLNEQTAKLLKDQTVYQHNAQVAAETTQKLDNLNSMIRS